MPQPVNARLYFLLARTPMHLGCGDSLGTIDKPTRRHVVTQHPQVPGSSLKGCLRDPAQQWMGSTGVDAIGDGSEHTALFGSSTGQAGMLAPQDAQLVLLPVACHAGGWGWVTSPAVLLRLRRAALATVLAAHQQPPAQVPTPTALQALVADRKGPLVTWIDNVASVVLLEELLDAVQDPVVGSWAAWLASVAMHGEPQDWVESFRTRLTIVHDETFDWLCEIGTDVRVRNQIGPDGVAEDQKLWREECVPEDSLFYGTLCVQRVADAPLTEAQALKLPQPCDLQVGGRGSVGYGFASFRPVRMP